MNSKNDHPGRMKRTILAAMAASAVLLGLAPPASSKAEKPNVILIMVDDLGYNDLSCYGSEKIKTPVLDKMAEEGTRLTHFYTGAAVCSPSRMALLSGSYPARLGWEGGVLGFGMKGFSGLPLDVVTIAETFQKAGYCTGISGKWHVGTKDLLPMHQGFEETYYIVASNNQTKALWRGDELLDESFDNRRFTEAFTKEAIRFITADKNKPFFLYLPYTAPHFPAEAHPDWEGHSANGAYGDVVEEMDSRVGEILDTLKKTGLDDNTIVVFLSDNGPDRSQSRFASAAPLSGIKWTSREGGTRVPCIVRFPGVIPARQISDRLTAAIDLYPTLAHACGVDISIPKGGQKLDGVNVWGTLVGQDWEHARNVLLYWHGWGEATAIRRGDWKLFFGSAKGDPGIEQGPALFNLKEDPGEQNDVSAEHPDTVKDLLALAREQLKDIHTNYVPIGAWKENQWRVKDWKPQRKWGKWLIEK